MPQHEDQQESVYQQLVSKGLSEEQIQLIMELGMFSGEEKTIARESEFAGDARLTANPEGRNVRNNIFVAASPFEQVATQAERLRGFAKQQRLDKRSGEISKEQVRRRIELLRAIGREGDGPTSHAVTEPLPESVAPTMQPLPPQMPAAPVAAPPAPVAAPQQLNPSSVSRGPPTRPNNRSAAAALRAARLRATQFQQQQPAPENYPEVMF